MSNLVHTGQAIGWYHCDGKDCPICSVPPKIEYVMDSVCSAATLLVEKLSEEKRQKDKSHLEKVLTTHWISGIECDHQKRRDQASCACGWVSEWEPNVGHAVLAWARHTILFI